MSKKQERTLVHWYEMLVKVVGKWDGYATAGEVAKFTGVSRNTAKKWLDALVDVNAALREPYKHKNGTMANFYRPTQER